MDLKNNLKLIFNASCSICEFMMISCLNEFTIICLKNENGSQSKEGMTEMSLEGQGLAGITVS